MIACASYLYMAVARSSSSGDTLRYVASYFRFCERRHIEWPAVGDAKSRRSIYTRSGSTDLTLPCLHAELAELQQMTLFPHSTPRGCTCSQ